MTEGVNRLAFPVTPRPVGRGIAAIAAGPDRARWNQRSVTSAELAREDDLDGRSPDSWAV